MPRSFLTAIFLLVPATPLLAAEEASPSVFAGTIIQSITAIIVFLLLFALLYRFAWNPILKGLQGREEKIRSDLEKAEQAARQAEQTLREYQKQLAEARDEATRIIDNGRREAENLAHQIEDQTRRELIDLRRQVEADLRVAKEQVLTELYTQSATLATQIAGKILQREIKPQDQQQLVAAALAAMPKERMN